jgi:hypothetical protein
MSTPGSITQQTCAWYSGADQAHMKLLSLSFQYSWAHLHALPPRRAKQGRPAGAGAVPPHGRPLPRRATRCADIGRVPPHGRRRWGPIRAHRGSGLGWGPIRAGAVRHAEADSNRSSTVACALFSPSSDCTQQRLHAARSRLSPMSTEYLRSRHGVGHEQGVAHASRESPVASRLSRAREESSHGTATPRPARMQGQRGEGVLGCLGQDRLRGMRLPWGCACHGQRRRALVGHCGPGPGLTITFDH